MPYIIHVPQVPRPYITNNPNIFMDCQSWPGWTAESRPYSDSFCKAVRRQENARYEADRRAEQLDRFWMAELERRERSNHVATDVETNDAAANTETDAANPTAPVRVSFKHKKNDSVHGFIEFVERKGSVVEVVDLDA